MPLEKACSHGSYNCHFMYKHIAMFRSDTWHVTFLIKLTLSVASVDVRYYFWRSIPPMKTTAENRESIGGRSTYWQNLYYLPPSSATFYRRTLLHKFHAVPLWVYGIERCKAINRNLQTEKGRTFSQAQAKLMKSVRKIMWKFSAKSSEVRTQCTTRRHSRNRNGREWPITYTETN
jgi:hypothetical protein